MGLERQRNLAVPRLVDRARRRGEAERSHGGRHRPRKDRRADRLAGRAERAEAIRRAEARVPLGQRHLCGRENLEPIPAAAGAAGRTRSADGVVGRVARARDADVQRAGRRRGVGQHAWLRHVHAGHDGRARRVEEPKRRREACGRRDADGERAWSRQGDLVEIDVVEAGGAVAEERIGRVGRRRGRRLLEHRADHHGRGDRGIGVVGAANLQPIELVAEISGEGQRGLARGGVVADGLRDLNGDIGPRRRVGFDEPVVPRILGRFGLQRVVGVEIHVDRVERVLQRVARAAGDRLRDDRHHLGAQIEPDVEAECRAAAERIARFGLQAATDRDAVQVVGQVLGEPQHDLVLVGEVVDGDDPDAVGGREGHVACIAKDAVTPCTLHRDGRERVRVDLRAGAEPQRDLLRRLAERLGRLARHEERRVGLGVGRHEIERHDATLLEPFHVARPRLTPPPRLPSRRPPRKQTLNRGQPRGAPHMTAFRKTCVNGCLARN